MKSKNINFELQGRVRKYLEYIMHKEINNEKEKNILNRLTHALRKEVILESNGKFLFNTELFTKKFSSSTLQKLAFTLKQSRYSPEEYIFHVLNHIIYLIDLTFSKKNDRDDCSIYIIEKGELEYICEYQNSPKIIKILKASSNFFIYKN